MLVAQGRVLVGGAIAEKVARQVAPAEPVLVAGPAPRFASRGGEKLDAALGFFELDVLGRLALDAGASTGGFTDCLLQRGAARVVAVDVGRGQLLPRLRSHPDVEVMEKVNVRNLSPADLGGRRFSIVVADLSFISLRTVAPALIGLAEPGGDLVVLVKPQFEAGRDVATKSRGVIRDAVVRADAVLGVAQAFAALGARPAGAMPSPLLGAEGNVEFCLYLKAAVEGLGVGHLGQPTAEALRAVAEEGRPWRP